MIWTILSPLGFQHGKNLGVLLLTGIEGMHFWEQQRDVRLGVVGTSAFVEVFIFTTDAPLVRKQKRL